MHFPSLEASARRFGGGGGDVGADADDGGGAVATWATKMAAAGFGHVPNVAAAAAAALP